MKQVLILSFLFPLLVQAQDLKQTIRGNIIDRESKATLPGANVLLYADTVFLSGTTTNEDGNFRLEGPVGRVDLVVRYIGYQDFFITNLVVSSGKEVVLQIELEESAQALDEVTITAFREGEVVNDMATVSVRSFTVEETDRYAGSRGDPARMASNFAGVQGADDSRNDLVIRGNSPIGVLWRLENLDIPNPNHFAIAGTTGGPVSIINNKYLSNSDFFTGAFPAEYGNATAGVFDLQMRKGNDEQYEFSGQLGFLGTELFAEGPLSKENKSSFLVSYRYSTLQLFESLNIQIGTEAVPRYQDGAVKLFFPLKNGSIS
ncbi:MAG: carboxypeptidase-like regulatory domain-containing protein, partial [Chitinophagales bacterium]|nr:carboxypeptidase-like regulatory domain-containing protein [Chitinophagales bacterium]